MKSIAVFCASSIGSKDIYRETAYNCGKALAKKNIRLVYGGASVGLMGALADGALASGGEVIGVLPHFLDRREIAHKKIEMIRVKSMHERKLKMHELSDACLTLPGGFGTMEEFFEMLTWAQLGLHEKPNAILNVNGFYDALINQFNVMVEDGLLKEKHRNILLIDNNIDTLIDKVLNYKAPEVEEWLKKKRL